ncbi:tetratricopeptide repeat protein [Rhizobium laguerreae]|uniref:tetratricopeptide repeat protein n=1 Tax=Rhizobium laguerreae TaxID=1076926 RepID=UPI001C929D6B|nr:tetratricopeptide repeat protein [Rhizobium laguerreae]MBY3568967.1 tetratricopeptide repeat protein [Rhizobium laguerreae]
MVANGVGSGARVVCESEARIEAERLLADPRLHVSERHKAFLRYIVDAFFEGRSGSVKAYSIAIDVFNRPTSFDPSSDPIVRIEATRLRESLQSYYKEIGGEPGARLDIPRGRYVPIFVERDQSPCPEEDALEFVEEVEGIPAGERAKARSIWKQAVIGLAVFCAVCMAGGYGVVRALIPAVDTEKPFVSLSLATAPEDRQAGDEFMQGLSVSMARFGTVRLKTGPANAGRRSGAAEQRSYHVSLRYEEDAASSAVWWQVADAATGEAVWTDRESRPMAAGSRAGEMTELVYAVSRRLAGPTGVVGAIELRRDLPVAATGNVCVLRGEYAIEQRDVTELKRARPCLEATIAADPADADAMATLARVFIWTGRALGDDSYFDRGLELANRAASLSPSSPRAALAQMATQYQLGQNETAIAAGKRGIALNPENVDLTARVSKVMYLSAQWEDGLGLARRAADVAGQPIRDASFVMILDAYRRGEYEQAVFLARQVPAPDTPICVLKLAAIARVGDRLVTEKEVADARLQHPDLDRTIAAMFFSVRYDKTLELALRTGVEQAGLKLPELASNGRT